MLQLGRFRPVGSYSRCHLIRAAVYRFLLDRERPCLSGLYVSLC